MASTLAERFARYAHQVRIDDLPADVVHETKRRFIDSLATAVGAMDADAFRIARTCALRVQGTPGAGLFGGGRSSVEWATFVNGLLIRYLDFNDTYLSLEPAHPSDNLAAASAELIVPLTSPWQQFARLGVKLFADTGTTWAAGQSLDTHACKWGYGGGVFLHATVFAFGLDLGWRDGRGTPNAHVQLGLHLTR